MQKLALACAGLVVTLGAVSITLRRELRNEQARPEHHTPAPPPAPLTVHPAPPEPVSVPPESALPRTPDKVIAPAIKQMLANEAALARDPDYLEARLQRLRLALPQDYPGLVEELGLSPDEASKLFDLLARAQSGKMSVNSTNPVDASAGLSADNLSSIQKIMQAREEIAHRRDESLRALLGNARFAQFREYEAGHPGRMRVEALGRTLSSLGRPLTAAQTRPLIPVFVAEEKLKQALSQKLANQSQPGQPVDQSLVDTEFTEFQAGSNQRILEAAQPLLDPAQLESLQSVLDQSLAESRAAARVRANR